MIVLNGSGESLIIKIDATADNTEPFFSATFATIAGGDKTKITDLDGNRGQTNGTTDVDLVPAPSGTDERDIKYISLHNDDTIAHTFEIIFDNGAQFPIWHGVLQPMQTATYRDGEWQTYDTDGAVISKSTLQSHGTSHQSGGADEFSMTGLIGLLGTDQNPVDHASDHQNGGGDEISVAGLSGVLAEDQNPTDHAPDHENGGSDEISVAGLSGLLADDQNPVDATEAVVGGAEIATQAETDAGVDDTRMVTPLKLETKPLELHAAAHENGGGDEISVAGLSGLLADDQNPTAHAADHVRGGSDEIDGDVLDIDFTPTNYTPIVTPAEVTNVDELTAHLAGIDTALSGRKILTFQKTFSLADIKTLGGLSLFTGTATEVLVNGGRISFRVPAYDGLEGNAAPMERDLDMAIPLNGAAAALIGSKITISGTTSFDGEREILAFTGQGGDMIIRTTDNSAGGESGSFAIEIGGTGAGLSADLLVGSEEVDLGENAEITRITFEVLGNAPGGYSLNEFGVFVVRRSTAGYHVVERNRRNILAAISSIADMAKEDFTTEQHSILSAGDTQDFSKIWAGFNIAAGLRLSDLTGLTSGIEMTIYYYSRVG